MKLHILSDLHIDSYQKRGLPLGSIPATEADVIILAGDISNSSMGMQWAKEQAKCLGKPMLYVSGNHEYYGENIDTFDSSLAKMAANTEVIYLQTQQYDHAGWRFLGCTMWTGFEFGIRPDLLGTGSERAKKNLMLLAQAHMRDYQGIRSTEGLLTPEMVLDLHMQHKAWLKNALIQAHKENIPTVAIVHHGVSEQSVAEKYANDPSNAAFINDFSGWMAEPWAPKLWVHGHVHDAFDYQCGNTRVVVNPRAYPSEISSTLDFDWAKVVEI